MPDRTKRYVSTIHKIWSAIDEDHVLRAADMFVVGSAIYNSLSADERPSIISTLVCIDCSLTCALLIFV